MVNLLPKFRTESFSENNIKLISNSYAGYACFVNRKSESFNVFYDQQHFIVRGPKYEFPEVYQYFYWIKTFHLVSINLKADLMLGFIFTLNYIPI